MARNNLKEMIDKMVEDSIRRVLPAIMNEVLLKTIANAGVLAESRPEKLKRGPKPKQKIKQPREGLRLQAARPKKSGRPESLNNLLDPEAGTEFYRNDDSAITESVDVEMEFDEDDVAPVAKNRLNSIAPELRHLAEDIRLDEDDANEMWGDNESAPIVTPQSGPPIDKAAKALSIDFSRMKNVVSKITPKKAAATNEDRKANAQFEAGRIKMMRERLNGGKPIE